jgi:hypothetical protein
MRWLAIIAAAALSSCHAHVVPEGVFVHVPSGHVCAPACRHPIVDESWSFENGHEHGPLCGHEYRDGRWEYPSEPVPTEAGRR